MAKRRILVLIVGGPDVDSRLDLIQHLYNDFRFVAVGSAAEPRSRFAKAGFDYYIYSLDRRINPLKDLITIGQLIKLFGQLQPHIVHAFDTKPCVLARGAARLAGVPTVIGTLPGLGSLYVDDSLTTRMVRMIYEELQRLACHLSDLTIFQNREDAQQFVSRGIAPAPKVRVILGSGVRTDLFNPGAIPKYERERVRAELGIPTNALMVTMVSRLIRSKGVAEFAAAAQIVRQQHPQTHFLLVGPADEKSMDRFTSPALLQLTRALTWAGARSDIPAILAASDIFVLPTFYREGIPRVLLEAASMALPIVTTDSPGCKEVVEPGVNGFLVPPHDPDTLAEAILRLVEEPDLRQRFGQESRRRAVTYFDLSVIAEQIRSIYRELLARKGLLPATEA